MKRRSFIKKTGMAAAGSVFAPYILPSGRLFAPTGRQLAQHVVVVMFAGGVRWQDSIGMQYLDGSQSGEPYAGNIMYNMLTGESPSQKIVFGTGEGGQTPIPPIQTSSLQSQGTLFPEISCLSSGHYGGLNSLVQGSSVITQGLKKRPVHPTIFEYLRRHGGYKATDTWFIGNGIGNSVPLLNFSSHPDYGAKYGANFFAPRITFGDVCAEYMADSKVYHPENELSPMYKLKTFLDQSFNNYADGLLAIGNTEEEKQNIKSFMEEMYNKSADGTIAMPPVSDRPDTQTTGYACEVLKWFKPACLFINYNDVDIAHSNFTASMAGLHRMDHAVGHLWDFIQNEIPEMAGNTTIIATPECGRNLSPNNILDENDWKAYDHSDANSLRAFTLMAGPNIPTNLTVGSESNPVGKVTDTMMTVADILGVMDQVEQAGMVQGGTTSLFNLI